jgi:hypothetical protein
MTPKFWVDVSAINCSRGCRAGVVLPFERKESVMVKGQFSNFEQLYRAAFAETDPEKKRVLLGEVCKAIEQWERSLSAKPTDDRGPVRPLSCCSPEGDPRDSGQAA